MEPKNNKIDRRDFLKTIGAAGLGSALISAAAKADPNTAAGSEQDRGPELPQVPKRKLGKTGVDVSCLALGTMFDTLDNQIVLEKAVQYGVTYWDTAHGYEGGRSEQGIGKFLSTRPHVRNRLFIVTKASGAKT
ncbi:MAG TPA: aldo/keto reductase, partial [Sedimentisphaerales bacterium]|nr:aldo/keto reductase [Sedimentisphaerales bacterium]